MIRTPIDLLIPALEAPKFVSIGDYFPVNNVFLSRASTLSRARQDLIEASTTEISMFLDSDVRLEQGPWGKKSLKLLEDGVDCVVLQPPLSVEPLQHYVSFYWRLRSMFDGSFFGTMATLFRTDLLKGIRIPDVDGAEDLFILLWLQSKGAKIATLRVPGLHHHSPDALKKGRWVGSGLKRLQREVGFRKVFPWVLRNIWLYLPATALVSILERRKDVMAYSLALWRSYASAYFES